MKYCCCMGLEPRKLEILKKHGYEAFEVGFSGLTNAEDEKIAEMCGKARELGMSCVSHNGMFPGNISLLHGKDGYGEISEYLERTIEKEKPLGSPVVVLGSGVARNIPDGMSRETAFERFVSMISDVVVPWARRNSITVAIEELRKEETNFINNCREAMEVVRAVDAPEVRLMVDYYHAMLGGDRLEEIASYGDMIRHVHIASVRNKRHFPMIDDVGDCRGFFAALKAAGYTGCVSLEGSDGGNFESSIAEAITVMKEAEKAL